jgi:hypothetical protein
MTKLNRSEINLSEKIHTPQPLENKGLSGLLLASRSAITQIAKFEPKNEYFLPASSQNNPSEQISKLKNELEYYQRHTKPIVKSDLLKKIAVTENSILQQSHKKDSNITISNPKLSKFGRIKKAVARLERQLDKYCVSFDKYYTQSQQVRVLKENLEEENFDLKKNEEKIVKEKKECLDKLLPQIKSINQLLCIDFSELNQMELSIWPVFQLMNEWQYQRPDNLLSFFNMYKFYISSLYLSPEKYERLWTEYRQISKTEDETLECFNKCRKIGLQKAAISRKISHANQSIRYLVQQINNLHQAINLTKGKINQLNNQQTQIFNNIEKEMKQQNGEQSRNINYLQIELKKLKDQYSQPDATEIKISEKISKAENAPKNPWIGKVNAQTALVKDVVITNEKFLKQTELIDFFNVFHLRNLHNGKEYCNLPTYRRHQILDYGETEAEIRALENFCHNLEIWLCSNLIIQMYLHNKKPSQENENAIRCLQQTNKKIIFQYDRSMNFTNQIIDSKVADYSYDKRMTTQASGVLAEVMFQTQLTGYIWFNKLSNLIHLRNATDEEEKKCQDIIFTFPYDRYSRYELPLQLTTMTVSSGFYAGKQKRTLKHGVALLTINQPDKILDEINQVKYQDSGFIKEIIVPRKRQKEYMHLFKLLSLSPKKIKII